MYPSPTFTNLRSYATEIFNTLRTAGRVAALWANVIGKRNQLERFPDQAKAGLSNKRLLGTQDILVEQVIGSYGRNGDFDKQFRPLKKHLRERWVNVYLSQNDWPPIIVHKIGAQYYVEDGHHRLSVSRALGMAYIRAEVWDYSVRTCQGPCKPQRQALKSLSSVSPAHS